jgi:formamidopyrimidine-DNA glycosylase
MPELPEVETTRRGIEPHLLNGHVTRLVVHERRLRWPVPTGLERTLAGQTVHSVARRGKYLLIGVDSGTLIVHLGMSGSLRLAQADTARLKHDHVELYLSGGSCLRYCDPRRFGAWLWTEADPFLHPLLASLGPEPLSRAFNGRQLFTMSRNSKQPIKTLIMNSHTVVGVGNIYANEALFLAGILPSRPANSLSKEEGQILANRIKTVLSRAIKRGGTTLRDFVGGDGKPGYFAQELLVYGRSGEACTHCSTTLIETRLGQRTTVFCPTCQH